MIRERPALGSDPGVAHFQGARAFELLARQCAQGPRIPGSEGHRQTARLILDELGQWADSVAVQEWEQPILGGAGAGQRLPMTNILAVMRGAEDDGLAPEDVRPDVMLCAHWDTRPIVDRDPDPAKRRLPVPGASDGASGVAVLLELARVLRAEIPRRTVVFAFWDGEDLGNHFYGSRLFARLCGRADFVRWRPRRAVLLDMVGGKDLRCTTEVNSLEYAAGLWNEVHDVARELGFEHHFHGPVRRIGDDHVMLNRAGIPSIALIDFGYPFHHTTGDTIERCSAESLQVVGSVLQGFLRA